MKGGLRKLDSITSHGFIDGASHDSVLGIQIAGTGQAVGLDTSFAAAGNITMINPPIVSAVVTIWLPF